MPTFDITRPRDIIPLSVDRKGSIPFTVTNLTPNLIKARLEVVPLAPADRGIFTIEGGAERNMQHGEALNIRVLVAAPEGIPSGSHKFWLKVADVDSPDDRYGESQSVEFVIPDSKPPSPPLSFKWWLIPVGLLLLIVAGGAFWYLSTHPKLEDYTKMSVDDAKLSLRQSGLDFKIQPNTTEVNTSDNDKIVAQQVDGKPAEAGHRVKSGTAVTLEVAEASPVIADFRGKKVDDAEFDLKSKGMKVTVVTTRIVLPAEQDQLVVEQTINGMPTPTGLRVKRGTEITLETQAAMPRLVGHTLSEAKSQLSSKGFPEPQVITNNTNPDASTWDKVFQQEPDPGPPPKPGSGTVQLWVNVKPDPVPGGMPNMVTKEYCQALRELSAAGLSAREDLMNFSATGPPVNGVNPNAIVRHQEPPPTTPILKGASGVVLTHSGGPIRCMRRFESDRIFATTRRGR